MKIDIITNSEREPHGSFTGVTSKTIWGDNHRVGCGGAELAILTLAEEWTKAGNEVVLYNNPWEFGVSPFEQRNVNTFDPMEDRDILIIFRSPVIKPIPAKGLKVWLSTDQQTVGDFAEFSKSVDRIVCISPFHANYFASIYGITNTIVIDLPVRLDDFKDKNISKVQNRFIFTSVPARGIKNFHRMWSKIKEKVRDASAVITSDYRLWGTGAGNEWARSMFMSCQDYEFLGAVSRERYIEELLKAEIFLYPCEYEELFCISCAEAECAGAYPITSTVGALATTNIGYKILTDPHDVRGDAIYIGESVDILRHRDRLATTVADITEKAIEKFSPKTVLDEWNEKVFK